MLQWHYIDEDDERRHERGGHAKIRVPRAEQAACGCLNPDRDGLLQLSQLSAASSS